MSVACVHFVLLKYLRYGLDTSTRHFGKLGTTSIPVPDTSVWFGTNSIPVPYTSMRSVRTLKYTPGTDIPFTKYRGYRYLFGTAPIPYQTLLYVSVRTRYRSPTLRRGRYEPDTGIVYLGKFGITSMPVPKTSVSSVRPRYRYPTLG